jgi:hypothetical protein
MSQVVQRSAHPKGALIAVVIATFVLVHIGPANAYSLTGCKWPGHAGASIYWTYDTSVTGLYYDAAIQSASKWTTYSTVNMTLSGSPYITVRAVNYGNVNYNGLSYYQCDPITGAYGLGATSDWNSYFTNSWGSAELQNVMVHELGHTIALWHNGVAPPPCPVPIMFVDHRNWTVCSEYTPQSDDIAGVNYAYR